MKSVGWGTSLQPWVRHLPLHQCQFQGQDFSWNGENRTVLMYNDLMWVPPGNFGQEVLLTQNLECSQSKVRGNRHAVRTGLGMMNWVVAKKFLCGFSSSWTSGPFNAVLGASRPTISSWCLQFQFRTPPLRPLDQTVSCNTLKVHEISQRLSPTNTAGSHRRHSTMYSSQMLISCGLTHDASSGPIPVANVHEKVSFKNISLSSSPLAFLLSFFLSFFLFLSSVMDTVFLSLSLSLSVCLSVSLCLSVCLSLCLSVCLSLCRSLSISLALSLSLSLALSPSLFPSLSLFLPKSIAFLASRDIPYLMGHIFSSLTECMQNIFSWTAT